MILLSLTFLLSALVAWAFNEWELRPWRRATGLHWTEQARLLHPARAARRSNLWTLPLTVAILGAFLDWPVHWLLLGFTSSFGTLLGNYPMDRETNPGVDFPRWSRLMAADLVLTYVPWIIIGVAAWFAPREFNGRFAAIVLACLAIHYAFQTGWERRFRRLLGLTHPASPALQRIVDETAGRMGVSVRATWESDHPTANAVAFPTTSELAFTRRLVAICTTAELAAVCAHEIGHLTESRATKAVRFAGSLFFFPVLFYRPLSTYDPSFAWAVIALAAFVIIIGAIKVAKAMERRADKVARENVEDPAVYAQALEKVYADGLLPATQPRKSTKIHPDLYDRMLSAGVTPAYERPAPPAGEGWTGKIARAALGVLVFCVITFPSWSDVPGLFDF